ncbi:K+/H+ antiporter subunit F [Paracoccus sp. Z118]|uniref:K+/H+ antiporter subunit F n=1 Tax=Paracoccus sp. Z118 TaxID=2851017 RepID=UPI001C2B8002|nr:K+/H+ antiporter subunit F [Paracoccus sp. Z118]MBV0890940.1 K+/H+ antiporter subunit F [Paracoccus sp. Z118]
MTATTFLAFVLTASQVLLAISLVLAALRGLRGPRAQDRVLGLDTMYVCAMLLMIVTGMREGSAYFFEAALVASALGFVATMAMAKFLMRGEVIE